MKIGITGTRFGMNASQSEIVRKLLKANYEPDAEFHHGDCVGVDVEAAWIADVMYNYKIVCHPPIKEEHRGFYSSDEYREKFSHFKRNRNIVDETELLLVVPFQEEHQKNGGTWYTHDYAVKRNKNLIRIKPNGSIERNFDGNNSLVKFLT